MALITATLETAVTPPLELDVLEDPSAPASSSSSSAGGGGGSWWGRLLKPRLTVRALGGTHRLTPYGAPGPWTTGAFVVAAALAALLVLAGVGLWHLVRGR